MALAELGVVRCHCSVEDSRAALFSLSLDQFNYSRHLINLRLIGNPYLPVPENDLGVSHPHVLSPPEPTPKNLDYVPTGQLWSCLTIALSINRSKTTNNNGAFCWDF